ncbi:1-acyl-sn-glycerol-3-phosphate acyltransferase alpha-like [Babylonia areolata]|uniref:1-acyl-sn-glycerol-3-phosphate acyltransferase alpha-like n=1 Tax=Babylonia areolata TaxID=304850 RepID=UPI003FCFB8FC
MALDVQWYLVAVLLILPLLYELSSTFRYYAKMCLYYTVVNLAAIFVIILSLWRPGDVENYRYVVMIGSEVRHLFGIDMEVRGKENLLGDEPYVLVANHQSSLDFMGMMEIWPSRCTALAKRSLQYMVPFGLAATMAGTVFVDRGNRDRAFDTMDGAAAAIRQKKIKIFIFPEGTRNRDGGMKAFKKGAFHLAVKAQVPVVPVVFSSYNEFYSKKEKRFDTGKLVVTCLPRVPTSGLTQEDVSALTERVQQDMLQTFNQMNSETRLTRGSNGCQ